MNDRSDPLRLSERMKRYLQREVETYRSNWNALSATARALRKHLFKVWPKLEHSPTLQELSKAMDTSQEAIHQLLRDECELMDIAYDSSSQQILSCGPLVSYETPWHVTLNNVGRVYAA